MTNLLGRRALGYRAIYKDGLYTDARFEGEIAIVEGKSVYLLLDDGRLQFIPHERVVVFPRDYVAELR
jgi:hypothetical protein